MTLKVSGITRTALTSLVFSCYYWLAYVSALEPYRNVTDRFRVAVMWLTAYDLEQYCSSFHPWPQLVRVLLTTFFHRYRNVKCDGVVYTHYWKLSMIMKSYRKTGFWSKKVWCTKAVEWIYRRVYRRAMLQIFQWCRINSSLSIN